MRNICVAFLSCFVMILSLNVIGAERIKLLPDALLKRREKLVLGGREAVIGEFPFQVSLQVIGDRGIPEGHICGGSILNEYTVLTAAHCFDDRPLQGHFEVVAGANMLKGPHEEVQRRLVDRIFIHPQYSQMFASDDVAIVNDIAIIRVRVPFIFNNYLQPARLPQADVYPEGDVQVSGWGYVFKAQTGNTAETLRVVDLPLLSQVECEAQILSSQQWRTGEWVKSLVCTKPLFGDITPWKGDSGGPLTQDGVLVGIVSSGDGKMPLAIYTRVSAFLKWIESKMPVSYSRVTHEL